MTYDRYYYSILPASDKPIYKTIYKGIQNFETYITIPKSTVSMQSIFQYVGLDNPHIFYVDFNEYNYSESFTNIVIHPTYWYTKPEMLEINEKIQKVLKKMSARISGDTEYKKEKSVHDLLVENVIYDMSALQDIDKYRSRSNSILGVLFYKTAVCEGISKVTKMLLNLQDIKCIVANGTANGEPHSWNIVKIEDEAYQLDVTWDINLSTKENFRYDYFNLSDKEMWSDHYPNIKYPICNSNKHNYFYKNKLVAKNLLDIEKIIAFGRLQCKTFISFKYTGNNFENAVKTAVNTAASVNVFGGMHTISYSTNKEQKICTINF